MFEGAIAADERADRGGDPDAAFNLGVLLYGGGDLDDAEAARHRDKGRAMCASWFSDSRGSFRHARAAGNLIFCFVIAMSCRSRQSPAER